ncbi:MAG: adenine deaminase C-terminal domain-containing protein [Sphaerochaeta sp.]
MEKTVENLKKLIRAGRGITPATTVIKGAQLVNVMSSEIYLAGVAIFEDTIVAIGDVDDYIGEDTKIIDAKNKYIVPGLIDGHIHSECSKLSITSYAKAVVPHGTTSMISGLDEYISVAGLEGLQEVFKEVEASPLKVFWGAPHKTPYTYPKSTISYDFTAETHEFVQKWPQCYGVWETVRESVLEEDKDTLGAIACAYKNKLPVFGCAPMARGKDLNGYLSAGVRLDHESYSHEEVVEKLRNGMHMLIRESVVTKFLAENIRAITEVNPYFSRRTSFCTDDVTAYEVLTYGHIDNVVRKAIKAGIAPITAIQMATINSAEAYRIDDKIGSISPGRIADILFVDNLEDFNVLEVMSDGKMVAKDSHISYKLDAPKRSEVLTSELKCKRATAEDFEYKVDLEEGTAKVLSMNVIGPFLRERKDAELAVKNYVVQPDINQDVAMCSVIERFGKNGNKSLAFCSGWNLKSGAMASSASPDDNNIVVIGTNAEDMAFAVNYLIDHKGGQVVVKDKEILNFLSLPVGGICSDEEPEVIAQKEIEISKAANLLGCDLPEPLMYMFFLPITCLPDYALTDIGPIDTKTLDVFDPILELKK